MTRLDIMQESLGDGLGRRPSTVLLLLYGRGVGHLTASRLAIPLFKTQKLLKNFLL